MVLGALRGADAVLDATKQRFDGPTIEGYLCRLLSGQQRIAPICWDELGTTLTLVAPIWRLSSDLMASISPKTEALIASLRIEFISSPLLNILKSRETAEW